MGNIIQRSDLAADGIQGQAGLLDMRIAEAEARILDLTGFWFYSVSTTLKLDGSGLEYLLMPQPVISLTSVTEDGADVSITGDMVIYNRRPTIGATVYGTPDDRKYPRLAKKSGTNFAAGGELIPITLWSKGYQNVVIVGTFGYTDLIGTVETPPVEIKRAAVRLVALLMYRAGSEEDRSALKVSKYASALTAGSLNVSFNPQSVGRLTGDAEIDDILGRYTHPLFGSRSPVAFAGA